MSGWVATSRQAAPPTSDEPLEGGRDAAHARSPEREDVRGVEDERELHQLGGLELERPDADPALGLQRAERRVADAGNPHREQREEGDAEQRPGQAAHDVEAAARGEPQHDQADRRRRRRSAPARRCRRAAGQRRGRRGAVDHHRAAREQAQRGRQQQAVLDRRAPRRRPRRSALRCAGSDAPLRRRKPSEFTSTARLRSPARNHAIAGSRVRPAIGGPTRRRPPHLIECA